jgi:hypothetical protein
MDLRNRIGVLMGIVELIQSAVQDRDENERHATKNEEGTIRASPRRAAATGGLSPVTSSFVEQNRLASRTE